MVLKNVLVITIVVIVILILIFMIFMYMSLNNMNRAVLTEFDNTSYLSQNEDDHKHLGNTLTLQECEGKVLKDKSCVGFTWIDGTINGVKNACYCIKNKAHEIYKMDGHISGDVGDVMQ